MNRDLIQGSWRQFKGQLKRWALMSDDAFTALAGRREQIAGRLQKAYGLARESSARQLSDWHKRMRQTVRLTCNSAVAQVPAVLISNRFTHQGTLMIKHKVTALAAAVALAISAGALAAMSKAEYKNAKSEIATGYKSDKAACGSFAANARDICNAEAKGKDNVARAELEAVYQPTKKTRYNVGIAKAEADYSIAREKCDDKAGNDKAVCIKEAQSARIAAKADAKAGMKTADANEIASDKTAAARATAGEKRTAARDDAATEKRKAEYAVAKEKCDTFAADAKVVCVREAKVRYGQS